MNYKHGYSGTPTSRSYYAMHNRCGNPKHQYYHNYGGKGIRVCKEWSTLARFVVDMGPRPEGHTLDRINNSLGYTKANCQWSDRKTQSRNTRTTTTPNAINQIYWLVSVGYSQQKIADFLGIDRSTVGYIARGDHHD